MKNKKLFAILTLVCFMMTLMPVAAFADETPKTAPIAGSTLSTTYEGSYLKLTVPVTPQTTTGTVYVYAHKSPARLLAKAEVPAGDASVNVNVPLNKLQEGDNLAAVQSFTKDVQPTATDMAVVQADTSAQVPVGFMKTAAENNANPAKNDQSASILVNEDDAVVTLADAQTGIDVKVYAKDASGENSYFDADKLFVWAVDADGISSALTAEVGGTALSETANISDVYVLGSTGKVAHGDVVTLKFARPGSYTVHFGYAKTAPSQLSDIEKLSARGIEPIEIKVKGVSVDPSTYTATLANDASNGVTAVAGDVAVDGTLGTIAITPNNVLSNDVDVNFAYADGKAIIGKTVQIETNSSSIEVNKATDVTDAFGNIDFRVSASVEGEYEIELTVEGVSWTIDVVVGNTAAAYIEAVSVPAAPQALYETVASAEIGFAITDINGNTVTSATTAVEANEGMDGIGGHNGLNNLKYLVLVEKPEASNLTSADLDLSYDAEDQLWYLSNTSIFDAEGTYAVKVILDNGSYATAKWTVKQFDTPVRLIVGYATNTVELGGSTTGKLLYVDKNGVQKSAADASFVANGYAVNRAMAISHPTKGRLGMVDIKTDEKYVGSKVDVMAVSDKYDLVGTATLTVVEGAVGVKVVDTTAEVNVNNKLTWNIVDGNGNKVALNGNVSDVDVSYVVLAKPEGAKVSTNDRTIVTDLTSKGEGVLSLTSNKAGTVEVQVVVRAALLAGANNDSQVKYYTGTATIAVGTGTTGKSVVMSIGSNELIVGSKVTTMDAKPMIQNSRTYVPFRALAEAFGATVAYDQATSSVTAELNGVKVVMTVGSPVYTVNGVEKTADVAPFISDSRTFVPVRFAAEAFGIEVVPTYNTDGSVADVLFNM